MKNQNSKEGEEDLKQPLELFEKVKNKYGLSKASRLATPEMAHLKFLDKKYDEAISLYQEFLAEIRGQAPYESMTMLALAACYEEKGEFNEAIETLQQIKANPDVEKVFEILRNGETIQIPVSIGHIGIDQPDGSTDTVGRVGISPYIATERINVFQSVVMAFRETKFIAVHTLDFFVKLVTGRMSTKLLGGPVMIAQMAGESARSGLTSLLGFTAFISINLALLNIFPIPAMDGGRIVFVLLEWIRRGKRISAKTEGLIHSIGFILLMGVFLAVTYQDILRFIRGESFF